MAPVPKPKPPVRALTLGLAQAHPLTEGTLERAASVLHQLSAAVADAGYEVQSERFSTRPLLADLADWPAADVVAYADELQKALDGLNVPFCSLGPALLGTSPERAEVLAEVIGGHEAINASVLVAAAEKGLDFQAARAAAQVINRLARGTDEGFGNFNFAALACVGPGTPFFPAAYHDAASTANSLTLALQGSSIVADALEGGAELSEVTRRVRDKVTEHAQPVVDLVQGHARQLGVDFGGIDLSPAPDGEDSIAAAMELAGHGPLGGPGTLALAAALTAGVQSTSLPTCGYCGLMLPVMEDVVLARRWEESRFGLDQLLSYSAVCGTGLDTIPLPGDCETDDLVSIICDVASLALRQRKPLSARLLPVPGKQAGERTEFSSVYLVNTLIKPLRPSTPAN